MAQIASTDIQTPETDLRTVQFPCERRKCSRFQLRTVKYLFFGTVLSLDPFLDHYLFLRVNANQSWNRSSGLDRARLTALRVEKM